MMHRVEEKFDLKPRRLVAATAYGTGPLLAWVVTERQIDAHPVWNESERGDGTLSRSFDSTKQAMRTFARVASASRALAAPPLLAQCCIARASLHATSAR